MTPERFDSLWVHSGFGIKACLNPGAPLGPVVRGESVLPPPSLSRWLGEQRTTSELVRCSNQPGGMALVLVDGLLNASRARMNQALFDRVAAGIHESRDGRVLSNRSLSHHCDTRWPDGRVLARRAPRAGGWASFRTVCDGN